MACAACAVPDLHVLFAAEEAPAEPEEPANLTADLSGENGGLAVDLSGNEDSTAGAQFVITAPALSVEVCCPTWSRPFSGYFTISLYKFDTDYAKTVASTPLKSVRYDEFDDNQWLSIEYPENAPLEPGEYLVLLSDPEPGQPSGVWMDKSCAQQICWTDGIVDEQHSIKSRVTFVGHPESYFGTPTPPKPETQEETGERGTAPYMDMTVIFNDPDWTYIFSDVSACSFDIEDYMTVNVGAADDPWFVIKFDDICADPGVPVKKYPVMKMKVRLAGDNDPKVGEIFYLTDNSPGAKAGNSVRLDYKDTDEWQYITIDFMAEKRCRDYLIGIRFDLFDHAPEGGTMEIEWITFFESVEAAEQFDGDFSKYASVTPTEAPRPTDAPVVTDAPKPTSAPTQNTEPVTETAAPATDKPADDKDIARNKKFPVVPVVIAASALAVIAVAAVVISAAIKRRKS